MKNPMYQSYQETMLSLIMNEAGVTGRDIRDNEPGCITRAVVRKFPQKELSINKNEFFKKYHLAMGATILENLGVIVNTLQTTAFIQRSITEQGRINSFKDDYAQNLLTLIDHKVSQLIYEPKNVRFFGRKFPQKNLRAMGFDMSTKTTHCLDNEMLFSAIMLIHYYRKAKKTLPSSPNVIYLAICQYVQAIAIGCWKFENPCLVATKNLYYGKMRSRMELILELAMYVCGKDIKKIREFATKRDEMGDDHNTFTAEEGVKFFNETKTVWVNPLLRTWYYCRPKIVLDNSKITMTADTKEFILAISFLMHIMNNESVNYTCWQGFGIKLA